MTIMREAQPANCLTKIKVKYLMQGAEMLDMKATVFLIYPSVAGIYDPYYPSHKLTGIIKADSSRTVCLQGHFDLGGFYYLLTMDKGGFDHVPYFTEFPRGTSRIMRNTEISTLAARHANAYIDFFYIREDGMGKHPVSHWVLNLQNGNSFSIAAYSDYHPSELIHNYPNTAPDATATTSALPLPVGSYNTIFMTQYYMNSFWDPFQCTLTITFKGIIRAAYWNAEFILAGSSIDPDTLQTISSYKRVGFQANLPTNNAEILTIVGYKIIDPEVSFHDCDNIDVDPLSMIQKRYVDSVIHGFDVDYDAYLPICTSNCISCSPMDECLLCDPDLGKFLSNGECKDICDDDDSYFFPILNSYCLNQQSSFALRNSDPIYDSSSKEIKINYEIDPYLAVEAIAIIYYPFSTQYRNFPAVLPLDSFASLAEASYYISEFSETSVPFSKTNTNGLLEMATDNNHQVHIIGYSLIKDQVLLVDYNDGSPNRAYSFRTTSDIAELGTLDSSKKYFVIFLMICPTECTISLDSFDGALEIILNERTILYSGNTAPYEILRKFTGRNHFKFTLSSSNGIIFSFTGSPTLYAPKHFLFEDSVEIPVSSDECSIANCQNCLTTETCLSCEVNQFLSVLGDTCTSDCGVNTANNREWFCECSINADCILVEKSYCDPESKRCVPCDGGENQCDHLFPEQGGKCVDGQCIPDTSSPTDPEIPQDTEEEEEETPGIRRAKKVTQALGIAGAATSVSLALTGAGASFLWIFLSILQKYYYLLFLNMNLPENLEKTLQALTFVRLDFLPNMPKLLIDNIDAELLSSPKHFKESGMDGLFFQNSGGHISVWFIFIIFGMCFKGLLAFSNSLPKKVAEYIKEKTDEFFWSGALRNWIAVFYDLSISVMLQFRVLNWDSFVRQTSSSVAMGILAINFGLIIVGFVLVKSSLKPKSNSDQFACLIKEFKDKPATCRYYNVVLLVRRFISSIALVLLYYNSYFQLYALIVIDAFHLGFLLLKRPYKGKKEQYMVIVDEIVFFIAYVLLAVYHSSKDNPDFGESTKEILSWVIVGVCGFGGLNALIVMFVDLILNIVELIKNMRKRSTPDKQAKIKDIIGDELSSTRALRQQQNRFVKTTTLEGPIKKKIIRKPLALKVKQVHWNQINHS